VLSILGLFTADLPDPGWVWVKRGLPGEPQFVNASGEVVTESQFARTDFPDVHESTISSSIFETIPARSISSPWPITPMKKGAR
jgi:hypothetical protein